MSGRVQYLLAATLDGFVAEEDGSLDWLFQFGGAGTGEESPVAAFLKTVGAIAMGSATYQWLLDADYWDYGDTPAWVFTSRGEQRRFEGSDIRFVAGRPAEFVDEMRAAAGDQVVWLMGGGNLADQFVEDGVLDDLLVTVAPVVLGKGIRMFERGRIVTPPLALAGVEQRGPMVELRYELEHSADGS
jgi:dihydrofolate reductase